MYDNLFPDQLIIFNLDQNKNRQIY